MPVKALPSFFFKIYWVSLVVVVVGSAFALKASHHLCNGIALIGKQLSRNGSDMPPTCLSPPPPPLVFVGGGTFEQVRDIALLFCFPSFLPLLPQSHREGRVFVLRPMGMQTDIVFDSFTAVFIFQHCYGKWLR